ncbi:unnamed protein product [Phaeothamnion confervicola]
MAATCNDRYNTLMARDECGASEEYPAIRRAYLAARERLEEAAARTASSFEDFEDTFRRLKEDANDLEQYISTRAAPAADEEILCALEGYDALTMILKTEPVLSDLRDPGGAAAAAERASRVRFDLATSVYEVRQPAAVEGCGRNGDNNCGNSGGAIGGSNGGGGGGGSSSSDDSEGPKHAASHEGAFQSAPRHGDGSFRGLSPTNTNETAAANGDDRDPWEALPHLLASIAAATEMTRANNNDDCGDGAEETKSGSNGSIAAGYGSRATSSAVARGQASSMTGVAGVAREKGPSVVGSAAVQNTPSIEAAGAAALTGAAAAATAAGGRLRPAAVVQPDVRDKMVGLSGKIRAKAAAQEKQIRQ